MRFCKTSLLNLTVFLALATVTHAQKSTKEDFEAYAETQTGNWVGEVTWITDWPGLGKKGDKVTAYYEGQRVENGNGVVGRMFAGEGTGTSLLVYDAQAKKIMETVVTSGGSVWVSTVVREGEKFVSHSIGSNPDGTKVDTTSTLTLSDEGRTAVWAGTVTVGDEKTTQKDTWRRTGAK